jgi:hypothetical protein
MPESEGKNEDADLLSDSWIVWLDEESADYGENSYEHEMNTIMKNFLQSSSTTAAADAARRFDTYYAEEFLPSDPLMRFKEDKGMAGFLICSMNLSSI